ncbi:hypothetical protein V501_10592 [Pseudogymnoascus sp. VKM F-4519 (FW-2642)]|nr:hypothetical protein V501_10592 [Pseudogymnoascus sp. VKM F-4519 (FW-2642)]
MAKLIPADAVSGDHTPETQDTKEVVSLSDAETPRPTSTRGQVPLSFKIISVALVAGIGFGSSWSSGVTGAMKSTLKKELKINNTQFALLESSEDFIKVLLILISGMITDRIGGASAILYGNVIYTIGSIFVAAATTVRNYPLMIFGRVVLAFGDVATQTAQYKIFSSWFPPNNGFASTLGFELAIGKIGGFVGKSTANIISKNLGDFSWVFWIALFMNIFTNLITLAFFFFTKYANKKFANIRDPSTGEELTEKNKKFEVKKVLEMPWVFWAVLAFSLLETSTALVFTQNATELAEHRFNTDSITAGWYTSVLQYAGFFVVPLIGIFIDLFGNRISLMAFCGIGVFISMALVNWANSTKGTAAAFGIYAFAYSFGPTVIIDSIRTSMWHQEVFGSAYSMKIMMNNSMNIIVNLITGRIQDADNDSYDRVVIVYVALAAGSVVVSIGLIVLSSISIDLRRLQWTRKQRLRNGHLIVERKERFLGENGAKNRKISLCCFGALCALSLGSWVAYIWGAATGNNY